MHSLSSIKVTAVFATMNRSQTAVACIDALKHQTVPLYCVIVADNGSTDGTIDTLKSLKDLPFELVVHCMPENQGNAGGVQVAMDLAFANDADAVWILDDDSWPRPDALKALVFSPWQDDVIRHPIQINPSTHDLTWPMWIERNHKWHLVFNAEQLPEQESFPSRVAWLGALIPINVWKTVGSVKGDLFIRGEDEEYPWRIAQNDFRFLAVKNSILDHPGTTKFHHIQFLGQHFIYERNLSDWKLYYKTRNMVWLKRKQHGNLRAIATACAYAVFATIFDGSIRLPLVLTACIDGWNGKLGRWNKGP